MRDCKMQKLTSFESMVMIWESFVGSFILGLGIMMLLNGCAYLTARQVTQMTPEQIDAFAKIKMNVYGCLQVGGPPIDGGFTYIILPVDAKIDLAFSSSCAILNSKVTK